jgi:putative ABC transport system substrate-binding protein
LHYPLPLVDLLRFSAHGAFDFSRPGGNATGFTIMEPTTSGKWLELLKDVAPQTKRVALLFNPRTAPFANYYLAP